VGEVTERNGGRLSRPSEELVVPSGRYAGPSGAGVAYSWSPEEAIGLAWMTKLRPQEIIRNVYPINGR
jgi:hypothetical protein